MVLNIVKVVESIDNTMRLQLKFVTLRHILAIRTRVLTFCIFLLALSIDLLQGLVLCLLHSPFLYGLRVSLRSAPLGMLG